MSKPRRELDCVRAILLQEAKGPQAVLGAVDAMKLRSCLTLFERAAPQQSVFGLALKRLYGGARDEATLVLLDNGAPVAGEDLSSAG